MTQEYSVNNVGGYIRYRRSHYAADRFVAILVVPESRRRRPSKREFTRAMEAMRYGRRVAARMARLEASPELVRLSLWRRLLHWFQAIMAGALARRKVAR